MSELVSYRREGDVAVVTVDNPPVNALSPGVPEGIAEQIARAQQDPHVRAVVLTGAGRTFVAGADIHEFEKMISGTSERTEVGLYDILDGIEGGAKPVVCVIHGTAFGGGLEFAQACHYRVAVSGALMGQPEVKLGIIPGAAGTQRLPRLVGVETALEMCVSGRPVTARQALEMGLVDRLVDDGDLLEGALDFAHEVADRPPRRTCDLDDKLGVEEANGSLFEAARALAARKMRGMLAPRRAVDAIEAATRLPFAEGCAQEKEYFQECLFSPQSKAMIHLFFGERTVGKIPDVPRDTQVLPIRRAAVVGAGTMGAGIAMAYANAGIPVVLKETSREALDTGLARIEKAYKSGAAKGRWSRQEAEERLARIEPTLDYDAFDDVDIAIEATFEAMDVKQQVFRDLNAVCREGAVLASNTSSLDLDVLAQETNRPEDVVGHHFFSPAHVMRLLEVVRGKATSKQVLATSMALAKRLGKVAVLVGNARGFVGNRMLEPFGREAQFLVEEGATPEQVDRVLTDFGMAMGPFAVMDLAGVDVGWKVRQAHPELEREAGRGRRLEDRLVSAGRFGQKTGAGWYRYEAGDRRPLPDPTVQALAEDVAAEAGIDRQEISEEEILERILYGLVNEGARVLDEGLALRPVDIDVIYVHGYGFPAFRGGPMHWADSRGLGTILERLEALRVRFGDHWRPSPLLRRLAEEGSGFADFRRPG